jgi:hypothetical protein
VQVFSGSPKAECLIELQRTLAENRRQTRSLEFQVNISLWTLIAASVWFLHGKVHISTDPGTWWFLAITLAVYLAHLFLWMRPIQKSEDSDAWRLREWTRLVEEYCGLTVSASTPQTGGAKWIFFETSLTALLLITAGIVLWK